MSGKRKRGRAKSSNREWVLPKLEHKVQPDLRMNGMQLVLDVCNIKNIEWVRTVEENVFVYARDSDARYAEKVKQLVFNIKNRPDLINFSPEILVALDDSELGKGTAAARWNEAYIAQKQVEKKMLTEDSHTNAAFFRCRACKSTNVEHQQKQTRSADEGMTIFLHCKDCDKRWKA